METFARNVARLVDAMQHAIDNESSFTVEFEGKNYEGGMLLDKFVDQIRAFDQLVQSVAGLSGTAVRLDLGDMHLAGPKVSITFHVKRLEAE